MSDETPVDLSEGAEILLAQGYGLALREAELESQGREVAFLRWIVKRARENATRKGVTGEFGGYIYFLLRDDQIVDNLDRWKRQQGGPAVFLKPFIGEPEQPLPPDPLARRGESDADRRAREQRDWNLAKEWLKIEPIHEKVKREKGTLPEARVYRLLPASWIDRGQDVARLRYLFQKEPFVIPSGMLPEDPFADPDYNPFEEA